MALPPPSREALLGRLSPDGGGAYLVANGRTGATPMSSNGNLHAGQPSPASTRRKALALPPPKLYTTSLIYIACQVGFIAFLFSYHGIGVGHVAHWVVDRLEENEYTNAKLTGMREWFHSTFNAGAFVRREKRQMAEGTMFDPHVTIGKDDLAVFTPEQLGLFDGSRQSRPVYLAILGRVYDVDRGKKHYGKGGGYSFFAGRDATRAFVTGDFTPDGLRDDIGDLSHEDILGIRDWVAFYEKDYKLVGVVTGRYYDAQGVPTEEMHQFAARVDSATEWRASKAAEAEVFPPCNSEWHKDSGGRVWCTKRSGGIEREWAGLPRLYTDPATKSKRCVCVKNFGEGLSAQADPAGGRGDLGHPALEIYAGCKDSANSCKIESD